MCFGQDLCEDISAGFLTLSSDTPHVHDADVSYEAHLGDLHKLSVKVGICKLEVLEDEGKKEWETSLFMHIM